MPPCRAMYFVELLLLPSALALLVHRMCRATRFSCASQASLQKTVIQILQSFMQSRYQGGPQPVKPIFSCGALWIPGNYFPQYTAALSYAYTLTYTSKKKTSHSNRKAKYPTTGGVRWSSPTQLLVNLPINSVSMGDQTGSHSR